MKRFFKLLPFVSLLILSFTIGAFAQEQTGNVTVSLKDEQGKIIPGASLTIVSKTGVGYKRSAVTNEDGEFTFTNLAPGTYSVTSEATSSFGSSTANNIEVAVGKTSSVTVTAKTGNVNAVVDVVETGNATIDSSGSQIQTNISAKQIENIPAGVSFDSLLRLSPATRGEAKSGGFQVDGASGSENAFLVDGLDVSNFKSNTLNGVNNIPTGIVQEVSVKSSGFDAEFGGATGGVVSVVTKGGGNQFRGTFGTEFETQKLNSRPNLSLREVIVRAAPAGSGINANGAVYVQPSKNNGSSFFPTALISGPIIKDKLFGLANFSRQSFSITQTTNYYLNDTPNSYLNLNPANPNETYTQKTTYEYGFARLDANPFNNLRLSATYLWNPQINEGVIPDVNYNIGGAPPSLTANGTTLRGAAFTNLQGGRVNSTNLTSQAIWTASNNVILTGRFTRGFLNEKASAYGVPDATRIQCSGLSGTLGTFTSAQTGCQQGFQNIPANRLTPKQVSVKTNYEFDATFILSNFGGSHQIKTGYSNSKIFTDLNSNSNVTTGQIQLFYGRPLLSLSAAAAASGVTVNPLAIGSGVVSRFGTLAKGFNRNQSIYVQDKWQPVRRLTLNLGVRIENEFIPTFNGVATQVKYGWGDKIAPRAGFAFDPFGDGKTKIFGSYGKFFDRLKFELPAGSFGGDFFRRDFFDILPGEQYTAFTLSAVLGSFLGKSEGLCPVTVSGTRSRCHTDLRIPSFADPELKPFTQREFTFGVEREFFKNYLFTGRYTNKTVLDAVEDAGVINSIGSEIYKIVNPCKGLNKKDVAAAGYARCNEAQREYNAMQLSVERRLTSGFYFNANYTLSKLFGNYSGLASSDENGRTDPGVSRYFDVPFQGFAVGTGKPDNGRLATDRPHVFNFYGAYTYGWLGKNTNESTVSLFTTAQSGTPVTTTVELAGNEVILNGRGDLGRTPTFTRSDMAFNHRYKFGRDNRYSVVFNLNINNVLGERNVTDFYRLITETGVDLSFLGTPAAGGLGFTTQLAGENAAITTGVGNQIRAVLNSSATFLDPRYNATKPLASSFQAPRNVRFGFRFQF
jgi:Carboxypeptidase regulatory-like domain/TonB-dependent Receptor Plug Domain